MTTLQRFAALFLLLSLAVQAQDQAQNPEAYTGYWQGSIEIPGGPLGVGVEFNIEGDALTGAIDIPAQGAAGLPLENIALEDEALTFAIAGVPGEPTFIGRLVGESLRGDFSQSGQTFPFALERAEEALTLRRPQDPVPPFPYREEEVRYSSGQARQCRATRPPLVQVLRRRRSRRKSPTLATWWPLSGRATSKRPEPAPARAWRRASPTSPRRSARRPRSRPSPRRPRWRLWAPAGSRTFSPLTRPPICET
ncbi:MAG: hypothetical protein M3498_06875 [Deinococcota bacterium]|nr:hypothetical protein [Deinococcota bacterium]